MSLANSKIIFKTLEAALAQLRVHGGRLHYHSPCISHPWRVIPDSWKIETWGNL